MAEGLRSMAAIMAGAVIALAALPTAEAQRRPSDDRAAPYLRQLASSHDEADRVEAAFALAGLVGSNVERALALALAIDASVTVRAACARSLGRRSTPIARAALRMSATHDASAVVRTAARTALMSHGSAPPLPPSPECTEIGIVLIDSTDYGYRICGDRLERYARPWR